MEARRPYEDLYSAKPAIEMDGLPTAALYKRLEPLKHKIQEWKRRAWLEALKPPGEPYIGIVCGLEWTCLDEPGLWVQLLDQQTIQGWQRKLQGRPVPESVLPEPVTRGLVSLDRFPESLHEQLRNRQTAGTTRQDAEASQPLLSQFLPHATYRRGGKNLQSSWQNEVVQLQVEVSTLQGEEWVKVPELGLEQIQMLQNWLQVLEASSHKQHQRIEALLHQNPESCFRLIEQTIRAQKLGHHPPVTVSKRLGRQLVQQAPRHQKGEIMRWAHQLNAASP